MFQELLQTPCDLTANRDAGPQTLIKTALPRRSHGSGDPLSQERAHIYQCPVHCYVKFLQQRGIFTKDQATAKASHGQILFKADYNGRTLPAHLFSAMANPFSGDDPLLLRTVDFLAAQKSRFLLLHPLPTFRAARSPASPRLKILLFAGWIVEDGNSVPLCFTRAGLAPLGNVINDPSLNGWCDREILKDMEHLNQEIQETHFSRQELGRPVTITSPSGWSFFTCGRTTENLFSV